MNKKGIIIIIILITIITIPKKSQAMTMSRDIFAGLQQGNTGYINSNSYVEGLFSIENTGNFDDYTTSPFFYIDFCTTGNEPSFRVMSNTVGSMLHNNKSYRILSETCDINVNGTIYTNQPIYRQIFTISATGSDTCLTTGTLNQTYTCRVNTGQGRIYSETPYNTAYRVMKMGLSYNYPIDDLTYLNEMEKLSILNDIKEQLINNNANASIIGKLDTQIQQQQSTNDKLDELKEADYNGTTETPNTNGYDNYEQNEATLLSSLNGMSFNDVGIAIDTNSANFVWDTLDRIIHSNTIIFSMIISILSIGIIKLMLGR